MSVHNRNMFKFKKKVLSLNITRLNGSLSTLQKALLMHEVKAVFMFLEVSTNGSCWGNIHIWGGKWSVLIFLEVSNDESSRGWFWFITHNMSADRKTNFWTTKPWLFVHLVYFTVKTAHWNSLLLNFYLFLYFQ